MRYSGFDFIRQKSAEWKKFRSNFRDAYEILYFIDRKLEAEKKSAEMYLAHYIPRDPE